MQRFNPWFGHGVGYLCIVLLIVAVAASALRAEVITLKNGMQLKGTLTRVQSLNQDPPKQYGWQCGRAEDRVGGR